MTLVGEGVVVDVLTVSPASTIRLADTEGQEEMGRQQHCFSSAVNSSKTTSVLPMLGLLVVVKTLGETEVGLGVVVTAASSALLKSSSEMSS